MRSQSRRACSLCGAILALFLTTALASAHCDSGRLCTCPDCTVSRCYTDARWYVVETQSFRVCSDESQSTAESLARHAEALRAELLPKWTGQKRAAEQWAPKCQIVLHATQQSYVAAVGRGSERTLGSSLVKAEGGKILKRRIDLLGGTTNFLSAALPHELTHVVVKDRFTQDWIPRWADEGIAVLADPPAKQGRHRNDLRNALVSGTTFEAGALLALDDYPRPDRFGVFYGQSASLAEYLLNRKTPADFLEFIERARVAGYDTALQTCYDISNVRELDRVWRASVSSTLPAK